MPGYPDTETGKVGEAVNIEDVGGNKGLPALDGSQLYNLPGGTPAAHATSHKIGGADETEDAKARDVSNEPTGFPNLTDSVISFTAGTLTFQIAPAVTSFDLWVHGKRFTKNSAETKVITDTEGSWVFYYDDTGTLQAANSSYTDYSLYAPVAFLYWDATSNVAMFFADERHGVAMDWATHQYEHYTEGTQYVSGLALTLKTSPPPGTGNSAADAQVEIADGTIYDEDLVINITDGGGGFYDQDLRPIAQIPVYYRTGAGGVWRKKTANDYPLYENTGDRPSWNNPAGPWTLPEVTDGYFFNMWVLATNETTEPVIALVGQGEHEFCANAVAEGFDLMDFGTVPMQETKLLYQIVYEADETYTNAVKARICKILDFRSGHGALLGRSDEDSHPASAIAVLVDTFGKALTPADDTVQKALQTLDDAIPAGIAKESPGETFLGTLFAYPSSAGMTVGEVQFTRVWLIQGVILDRIRYFVVSGSSAARNVRAGLYDQADPQDETDDPRNLVASTASHSSTGTDGTFRTISLSSTYQVPATGYYWVAIVADSSALAFAVSASMRANFMPIRRESGTGTNLPATTGTLSNPTSAVAYVAVMEQ